MASHWGHTIYSQSLPSVAKTHQTKTNTRIARTATSIKNCPTTLANWCVPDSLVPDSLRPPTVSGCPTYAEGRHTGGIPLGTHHLQPVTAIRCKNAPNQNKHQDRPNRHKHQKLSDDARQLVCPRQSPAVPHTQKNSPSHSMYRRQCLRSKSVWATSCRKCLRLWRSSQGYSVGSVQGPEESIRW